MHHRVIRGVLGGGLGVVWEGGWGSKHFHVPTVTRHVSNKLLDVPITAQHFISALVHTLFYVVGSDRAPLFTASSTDLLKFSN